MIRTPNRFVLLMRILAGVGAQVRRLKPESMLSVDVACRLKAHSLTGDLRAVWFKVPNEGKRTPAVAAILKAMGMIPGVWDFVFLWQDGSGVIELKAGRNKLTGAQADFAHWCDLEGVRKAEARSYREVEAVLKEWGILV
jgi:hypothetical protein